MLRISALGIVAILALTTLGLAAVDASPGKTARLPLHHFFSSPTTPVEDFPIVRGSSATLMRGKHEVWMRLDTTQLRAGVYTAWWVIFNNPDQCTMAVAAR